MPNNWQILLETTYRYKTHMLSLFVPANTSFGLALLIVLVEVVSYSFHFIGSFWGRLYLMPHIVPYSYLNDVQLPLTVPQLQEMTNLISGDVTLSLVNWSEIFGLGMGSSGLVFLPGYIWILKFFYDPTYHAYQLVMVTNRPFALMIDGRGCLIHPDDSPLVGLILLSLLAFDFRSLRSDEERCNLVALTCLASLVHDGVATNPTALVSQHINWVTELVVFSDNLERRQLALSRIIVDCDEISQIHAFSTTWYDNVRSVAATSYEKSLILSNSVG